MLIFDTQFCVKNTSSSRNWQVPDTSGEVGGDDEYADGYHGGKGGVPEDWGLLLRTLEPM